MTDERARSRFNVWYAVWLFGAFSYFVPAATWNPVSRFSATRALVEEGTASIDAFAGSTGDRARVDGRWYSDKAPVPALAATVPYAAYHAFTRVRGEAPRYTAIGSDEFPARRVYVNASFQRGLYVCSLATAAFAGCILGALLFGLVRRRTNARTAVVAASAGVLGTPLFPYSTSFYGHVVAAALLFGALAAVDDEITDGDVSDRRLRIAGACLGLAPGCEYIVAVPAAAVGTWILYRATSGHRARTLGQLLLGAAGPIVIVSTYHTVIFGAPWRTPYSYIAAERFAAGHASGLFGIHLPSLDALGGLLVGERRGLFYVAPVALVGVVGAAAGAWRRCDVTAQISLVAFATLLLLNAGYYMWWGGAAAGPRHLVPVLGVIAFGVAWAWEKRILRPVIGALALVSLVNMAALTGVGLEAPEAGDVLTEYAFRRLVTGEVATMSGASNLAVELGFPPAASLGPLLAWLLVGFRLLYRRAEAEDGANPVEARTDERRAVGAGAG